MNSHIVDCLESRPGPFSQPQPTPAQTPARTGMPRRAGAKPRYTFTLHAQSDWYLPVHGVITGVMVPTRAWPAPSALATPMEPRVVTSAASAPVPPLPVGCPRVARAGVRRVRAQAAEG